MTTSAASMTAILVVSVVTLAIGTWGMRFARTTGDFMVASRSVKPVVNASAISGEYLSAASFLGAAGLILAHGASALWYPVGWTAGYLVLLVLVAAPLRRSGAYTLADFAEFRFESNAPRRLASVLVVLISILYLIPQFRGAGITVRTLTGAPTWVGVVIVAIVVLANVLAGGMRSITISQAFQYWLKLVALLAPAAIFLVVWNSDGRPAAAGLGDIDWVHPIVEQPHGLYLTYSLIVATFLGTMGLPHVAVRFYTNTDGRAARRTTLGVLVLLGCFYLLPTLYGFLGRVYASDLITTGTDSVVLELPARMLTGPLIDILTALLAAGAFAAFLSTSSGIAVSVAGVLSQDVIGRRLPGVPAFRVAAATAVAVTLVLTISSIGLPVAKSVELAFAVAASTFFPLLFLGIWWKGVTSAGAMAGMLAGGILSTGAVLTTLLGINLSGWPGAIISQPAACTVPVAISVMCAVSVLTRRHRPAGVLRMMVRLHLPEHVDVDRGTFDPEK